MKLFIAPNSAVTFDSAMGYPLIKIRNFLTSCVFFFCPKTPLIELNIIKRRISFSILSVDNSVNRLIETFVFHALSQK